MNYLVIIITLLLVMRKLTIQFDPVCNYISEQDFECKELEALGSVKD